MKCKIHILTKLILVIVSFLNLSCETGSEPPVYKTLHAPGFQTPVITGLRITDDAGNEIAVWRKPNDVEVRDNTGYFGGNYSSNIPTYISLSIPYPNPADGSIALGYALAKKSNVSLWIVPGQLPEEYESYTQKYFDVSLPYFDGASVADLVVNEPNEAGMYRINWNPTRNFPAGFYRIFLQVGDDILWRDLFLYRKQSDFPPDLLEALPEGFKLFF